VGVTAVRPDREHPGPPCGSARDAVRYAAQRSPPADRALALGLLGNRTAPVAQRIGTPPG
jgi:hypothetical protein